MIGDIFSDKNVEAALMYLRDSDSEFGRLKGRLMSLEKNEKILFGAEYLESEGTVDERKGLAFNSTAYKQWKEDFEEVATDLHILTAKRATKMAFLEIWRSVNSGRRQGHV